MLRKNVRHLSSNKALALPVENFSGCLFTTKSDISCYLPRISLISREVSFSSSSTSSSLLSSIIIPEWEIFYNSFSSSVSSSAYSSMRSATSASSTSKPMERPMDTISSSIGPNPSNPFRFKITSGHNFLQAEFNVLLVTPYQTISISLRQITML
ncbi:hypothetical protein NPIL_566701 [Nephila pilipes]|uniref:Uncharacterized protein n=1 Tax=Nephila pilipes TaxID=299642 RepID=A0A8X6TL97_NEPPI|nr:hypothetical protein NPIL_566701 [Nephila pilipes]